MAATERHRAGGRAVPLATCAVLLVIAVAIVALFWKLSWQSSVVQSDDANAVLASDDMAHGNMLLKEWDLPADSYWSLDLMIGTPVVAFLGPRDTSAHVVALVIAVAAIVVSALVATAELTLRQAAVGVGVVLLMLALPVPARPHLRPARQRSCPPG